MSDFLKPYFQQRTLCYYFFVFYGDISGQKFNFLQRNANGILLLNVTEVHEQVYWNFSPLLFHHDRDPCGISQVTYVYHNGRKFNIFVQYLYLIAWLSNSKVINK